MIKQAYITARGEQKLSQAELTGQKARIATFAVGSGNAFDNPARNSLVAEFFRAPVDLVRPVNGDPNTVEVSVFVPADAGSGSYRELGLIDEDGDMVAVYELDHIEKSDDSLLQINLLPLITYSNAAEVIIQLDPNIGTASRGYVDSELNALRSSVASNVLGHIIQSYKILLAEPREAEVIIKEPAVPSNQNDFEYIAGVYYPVLFNSWAPNVPAVEYRNRIFLIPFIPRADLTLDRLAYSHDGGSTDIVHGAIYGRTGQLLVSGSADPADAPPYDVELQPLTLLKNEYYLISLLAASGLAGAIASDQTLIKQALEMPTLAAVAVRHPSQRNLIIRSSDVATELPNQIDFNDFELTDSGPAAQVRTVGE